MRRFSGKVKQTQAPLSTLEAPLKHLEANQANQAVNVTVTVTVNGTGIVNVIDYSLLVQSACAKRAAELREIGAVCSLRAAAAAPVRAPALTKNAHAGEGFSPLLQKSAICR